MSISNTEFLERDFIRGDPRLRACLELATEAHAKFARRNGTPYIEHPKLLCNLLDAFGASEAQKAVALLHDTLEVESAFHNDPARLKAALLQKLAEASPPGSLEESAALGAWADHVCEGVRQLTLGGYMFEGKRTYLIDAIPSIDKEWRPVKILDQATSVIGDILHSNPQDLKGLKRNMAAALKGLDVSRACQAGVNSAYPYHDFYKRVYNQFRAYYLAGIKHEQQAGEAVRANFTLERIIADSLDPKKKERVSPEKVTAFYNPLLKERFTASKLNKGLAYYNKVEGTSRVVSFGLFVSPETESAANSIATKFRDYLESIPGQFVETEASPKPVIRYKGEEIHKGDTRVRNYKLAKSVDLTVFTRWAKEAGVLEMNARPDKWAGADTSRRARQL